MPSGVPYIIGNEFAERFSFYGMRAVLFAFMTTALVTHDGAKDLMSEAKATEWVHLFITAVYFTPLIGALLAVICLALAGCADSDGAAKSCDEALQEAPEHEGLACLP